MFRGIVPDFNTDFKKQNSKKESIVYSSEYYSKFQMMMLIIKSY